MKSNIIAIFSMFTIATILLACMTPVALGQSSPGIPGTANNNAAGRNPDRTDGSDYVPTDNKIPYMATTVTSTLIGTAYGIYVGLGVYTGVSTAVTGWGASTFVAGCAGGVVGTLSGVGIVIGILGLGLFLVSLYMQG